LAWFIRRWLCSVEDLEVLLLLWRTRERWWTAAEVAARLPTTFAVADDSLQRLADGLFELEPAGDPRFRFAAENAEHDSTVASLHQLYTEDRTAVLRLIVPRPSSAVLDFADAFKLRRDE
jgi:hypothetical protein